MTPTHSMSRLLLLSVLALAACGDKDGDTDDTSVEVVDEDGDGVSAEADCDDADATVYPGAVETCDDVDNDCDGEIDNDATDATVYYPDADGDGHGVTTGAVTACAGGDGWAELADDCDDGDATAYPGAEESCDDVDNDCNGLVDDEATDGVTSYLDLDGDGFGDDASEQVSCEVPDGYVEQGGDCEPGNSGAYPGGEETWYDGIDGDCSGTSDYDQDEDGEDAQAYGGTDCEDEDPGINSAATETWYDGIDSDCSGTSDYDADGDGEEADAYGGVDCDDDDPAVNTQGTDTWYDGVDSDCSGGSDYDADGDSFDSDGYGGTDCDDADSSVRPYAFEDVTDGIDNDCDTYTDTADPELPIGLNSTDDDYDRLSFSSLSIPFCGTSWTSAYAQSNGQVTFGFYHSDYSESVGEFLGDGASVAPWWDDMNPTTAGDLYWVEYGDALGVYWVGVPEFGTTTPNYFSLVMFDDGTMYVGLDSVSNSDGIIGWSCGSSANAVATDISEAWSSLPSGAWALGMGTETAYYESFSSGNDLSGQHLWFCGNDGVDGDGDGWTTTCGDTDDNDATVYPQ